jgi:hypothetical protein
MNQPDVAMAMMMELLDTKFLLSCDRLIMSYGVVLDLEYDTAGSGYDCSPASDGISGGKMAGEESFPLSDVTGL